VKARHQCLIESLAVPYHEMDGNSHRCEVKWLKLAAARPSVPSRSSSSSSSPDGPVVAIEGNQTFEFGVHRGISTLEQFVCNDLETNSSMPPPPVHVNIDAYARGISGEGPLQFGVHDESSSVTQIHSFNFKISASYEKS
jgi:hypothetical protein